MKNLAVSMGLLALVITQSACAEESNADTSVITLAAAEAPLSVSQPPESLETDVLLKKAADNEKASGGSTVESVRAAINQKLAGMVIDSLSTSEIAGVYELVAEGNIYYINDDASFLIRGDMIDLTTRVNITEQKLGGIHMGELAKMDESQMIIYEPKKPSNRSITVFTDISCGYCRKLHAEIETLLDEGVRVRYLMFPRGGLNSAGYQALESVWCSKDPLKAMTTAKSGGRVKEQSCENPIEAHMALANKVGLQGTPLIFLDTGERVNGYRDANTLANLVNAGKPLKVAQ